MPFTWFAMFLFWWKPALPPKEPHVIVLMPEDEPPEVSMKAPAVTSYQG